MLNNNFQLKKFQNTEKYTSNKKEIHYYDLPHGLKVKAENLPKNLRLRGHTKTITIGRLIRNFGKNKKVDKCIQYLLNTRNKEYKVKLNLPINLVNIDYVRLYSLMLSEGSKRTEFRLHVPEKELHDIFLNSLDNLLAIKNLIKKDSYRNVPRSNAPRLVRYILPIPNKIPNFIIKDKEFAKEYLRIAFECEGYVRFKLISNRVQRFIKISRNNDITDIVGKRLRYPSEKRIFVRNFKNNYPQLYEKVIRNIGAIILMEQWMLKKHFDIDSKLVLESIRINKTSFRAGKISAKWVLKIYSENINKFINEIGFLSKKKNSICEKILKSNSHRPKYFVLDLMRGVSKNNIFLRHDFYKEMKKLGYKSPRSFVARYIKKGLIKDLKNNSFKIIK